ncbi:hypothetical protein CTI12_AA106390 [Artemisia annua]|uniref:Uncharacterized protein n=1 Tax=Artemisia annua TaxID=35608 RepID=A0A2U1PVY2_ARTAN|nr:hypothetical protein CTI12_AA106390 [Artemisia annua]
MESRISSLSLSEPTLQNSTPKSTPSVNRLWRPAAQRNMKNQWSKLNSLRQDWVSSSSNARSHATALVNSFLSQRYMKDIELGVLKDMPDIQNKAWFKLLKQQVLHRDNLLSTYKEMVSAVVNMVSASTSLRCFLKGGTNSPLIQFSSSSEDTNDDGDGGGIPVFTFWSITSFEELAREVIRMYKSELYLKRLLVIEFLSLRTKEDSIIKKMCWSDEIYQGEFDDLSKCNLDHKEVSESAPPKLDGSISETLTQPSSQPDSDVLQVCDSKKLRVVNCRLGTGYMKDIELGVLKDMPDIQNKACFKLLKQQVLHRDNLLSTYKEMVAAVVNMVSASTSLRCFLKGGTNSPLIQFSSSSEDINDDGDGGGIPVFTFWSITSFEELARELIRMYKSELYLKRLLVIEFLSLRTKEDSIIKKMCWSDEIYQGEFDDLSKCNLDRKEVSESAPPKLDGCISETLTQPSSQPDSDVLQIYLTAWLTDVNIDKQRVEDIFSEVGEEMNVNFVF